MCGDESSPDRATSNLVKGKTLAWLDPRFAADGRFLRPASVHHRRDEFPPVIPWRVALQQSPPLLQRLASIVQHLSQFAN